MALSKDGLIDFFDKKLGVSSDSIDDETLLFSSGIMDSFSMVDLIMFIENEGGLKLSPTEVTLENLDSVARILHFVATREQNEPQRAE